MSKRHLPAIAVLSGVAAFIIGVAIPHIPYTQPGTGWHWTAAQADRNCTGAHQVFGTQTSALALCQTAHGFLLVSGSLIILGLATAATGVVVTIRRRLQARRVAAGTTA
jgi:hypothetical protein